MVVVGGVLRSGGDFLAGAILEHIQLRDRAHGHVHTTHVAVVVFLRDANDLTGLEVGEFLAHIIGLAGHIVAGIDHQHVACSGLIIAIFAGLLVCFIREHAELGNFGGVVATVRAEGRAEIAGALLHAEELGHHRIGGQQLNILGKRRGKGSRQQGCHQKENFLFHGVYLWFDISQAQHVEEFV